MDTVLVFEMRGDTTAESCGKACNKLTVGKVASVTMATQARGADIIAVQCDPSKGGRSFICTLDDKAPPAPCSFSLLMRPVSPWQTILRLESPDPVSFPCCLLLPPPPSFPPTAAPFLCCGLFTLCGQQAIPFLNRSEGLFSFSTIGRRERPRLKW